MRRDFADDVGILYARSTKSKKKLPTASRRAGRRAAARNTATGGGTPSISVDQNKIDYGEVTFGVKVTNTGDGTLRFKEQPSIKVLEGC